jgi:hypothetical protein
MLPDYGGAVLTFEIIRLRHRRRFWAWTGWASLAGWLVVSAIVGALHPGTAADVLSLVWLAASVVAVIALGTAAVDTMRLHRKVNAARATAPDPSQDVFAGTLARGDSRGQETLPGVMRALDVIRIVLMLLFIVYLISMQAEAVAYLAGSRNTGFAGATPPIPFDSDVDAVADIIMGLVSEVLFGLILLITSVFTRSWLHDRRQVRRWRKDQLR